MIGLIIYRSEHADKVSPGIVEVLINRQQEHEGKKDSTSTEEVPDVVTIVEVEEETVSVERSGLCWRYVGGLFNFFE